MNNGQMHVQSLNDLIISVFMFGNVSTVQAEGIPVSPYIVRKALENTAIPIGNSAEEKLSTGQGLMQVDKLVVVPCLYLWGM